MAMRARGVEVLLTDHDKAAVRMAVEIGAGSALPEDDPDAPADIAVLAVPVAAVGATLRAAQKRGLARVYTDVASVKARPVLDAMELGCDLRSFVPGHPLAGRERSGPAAARGD
ncbi:prephenate dehydrogenase/arogenate dehydrogenase family protein, partial [Actinomadura sp. HBU206391]|nr:prephenate dehydrogenase/arogenate dehydrogenase family protein [Actinomadura sp. HBU206391]